MSKPIRGLFLLEPPSGGLDRLRQEIRQHEHPARWQTVLPWAATACLLLLISAPLVVERLREWRDGRLAAEQIVDSARAADTQPLTALPSGRADVQVYLAVPTSMEVTAE